MTTLVDTGQGITVESAENAGTLVLVSDHIAAQITGSGTVTSVAATVPTGLSIAGSPITGSGTLAITFTAGYSIPTTAKQTEWDTAYTDRNKWDGGATGLTAATGRTSLGLDIGTNVQAWSANLDEYAAVNPTAAGLALLDDADAAAQRVTMGAAQAASFFVQAADRTLTSTTASQKIFDNTGSQAGAITLATGIYEVRLRLWLSGMSATTGNGEFNILGAGTATLARQVIVNLGCDSTTPTAAVTARMSAMLGSNVSPTYVITDGTGTALLAEIAGTFEVTVAGTIIPSFALTTAAAATVEQGSSIIIQKIAEAGVYSSGDVS